MTAAQRPTGELCSVRVRRDHMGVAVDYICGNLAAQTCDVLLFPASGKTVELSLCIAHLALLGAADDPAQTAREWLLSSVAP